MKIYSAIPKIMLEMEAIGKDQTNKQQNFKFRGIDQVYNAIQKLLAKHGVFSFPLKIIEIHRDKITSKQGSEGWLTINHYIFRFCCDDESFIDVESIGEAADYGDKGNNKAASIAHKYSLLQVFMIPTEEEKDPDYQYHEIKMETKQETIKDRTGKAILEIEGIKTLDMLNVRFDKFKEVKSQFSEIEQKILNDVFAKKFKEMEPK